MDLARRAWTSFGPRFRSTDDAAARLKEWVAAVQLGSDGSPRLTSAYEQTVAVFQCVTVIASNLARIPLEVYSERTTERVESGPVVDLISAPNPLMTTQRFAQTVATHLLLDGNAFVYIDEVPSRNVPRALFPLQPSLVSPVRPRGNAWQLDGWRMSGATPITFAPEEVARFEYAPHETDPLRGVSPLGAARLVVESDHLASQYNRAVLKNGGALAGLLKYKGEGTIPEGKQTEIERKWHERYGGPTKVDRVAVLSGNFDYQPLAVPHKDMQFLQMREWNLADIARAFGVPLLFLNQFDGSGLSDAGLRVQERMLYRNRIIPLAVHIAQVLTTSVAKRLDRDAVVVFNWDTVEALREDQERKLGQAERLKNLGYPLNAINEALDLGMPEMPWGDESLVSAGLITASAAIEYSSLPDEPPTLSPSAKLPAPAGQESSTPLPITESLLNGAQMQVALDIVKAVAAGEIPRDTGIGLLIQLLGLSPEQAEHIMGTAGTSTPTTPNPQPAPPAAAASAKRALIMTAEREALWRRLSRPQVQREERLYRKIRRNLRTQREAVLAALDRLAPERGLQRDRPRRTPRSIADEVAAEFDTDRFVAAMEADIVNAWIGGSKTAMDDLSIESDEAIQFQSQRVPEIALDAFRRREQDIDKSGRGIRERVRDTLLEGLTKGENLKDLKDRVRQEFNAASVKRARVIARTETQIALQGGRFGMLSREHAGREVEWVSARDEVVRKEHQIDGERVTVGEKFPNGLKHPGDPDVDDPGIIVNCRCQTIPVTDLSGPPEEVSYEAEE